MKNSFMDEKEFDDVIEPFMDETPVERKKTLLDKIGFVVKGGLIAYASLCMLANQTTFTFLGDKLNENEVKEIVESKRKYFKDKKVNLIFFEDSLLKKKSVGAFMYTSKGEYNVALNKEKMYESLLLHELGHVILHGAEKDSVSINDCFNALNNSQYLVSPVDIAKYILSPEELLCNIYAQVGK